MKIKSIVISIISLVFVSIGLVFGLFEQKLCSSICELCSQEQINPCYFLFLFVGIIFVVAGAGLFNNYNNLKKESQGNNQRNK